MKGIFEIVSIVSDWSPPFQKMKDTKEAEVGLNEGFDQVTGVEGATFKLLKLEQGKALVEYNHLFTLKGHERPRDRQVWLEAGKEAKYFTYLWGNKGFTKIISLKHMLDGNGSMEEQAKEVATEQQLKQ